MSTKSKLMLTRRQLAAFLADPDAIKAFERVLKASDSVEVVQSGQTFETGTVVAGSPVYYSGSTNKPGIWRVTLSVRINISGLLDFVNSGLSAPGTGLKFTVPVGETAYYSAERLSE
jgi:hypothetical protein